MARAVLAMLLATGLLIAACFLLGQAVLALCGWREPRWWAAAVGYAVLLIVFGQAVRMRDAQTLLLVVALVAVAASLALRPVRAAVRAQAGEAVLVGVGLTLVAAIPFFAFGHAGILGATVSDDMSQHLSTAWWLTHDWAPRPVAAVGGDLISTGYPLGPHGLAAGLGHGLGLGEARGFSALTLAVPAVTGMAAYGLVPRARRGARLALAAAVGLGYLQAAYLAQGSFKETLLASLVLAAAVALGDVAATGARPGWRRAMPVAVIAGGAVYDYSYGALLWMAALVLVFVAIEVLRRRELFAPARRWWRAAVGAVALAAVVILPELGRMQDFRHSSFGQESLRSSGNLVHAVNPLETLGVWFSGDFRFNPDPRWPTTVFCVVALVAFAGAIAWSWRRRAHALPAAIVAALVVWAQLTQTVNIYNAAKGLVVLAPLVMACLGAALAAAWAPGRSAPRVVRLTGIVLFAGVAVSSFGVLRSAPVGLGGHDAELAQIRRLVQHQPLLFLDNDHFGQWELRGAAPLYATGVLYAPARLEQRLQKHGGLRVDVDNFSSPELDKVIWIVVAGARYRSQIPPSFRLVLRTSSYDLYRRDRATPPRAPIEAPGTPGAVFDCESARGRAYLARYAWAGVLPRPVVSTSWKGSIARPGETARLTVTLPRGRWDVSLRYLSTTALTVRGPGLERRLAANFGLITSFWPAGTVTSDGRPLTLTLTSDRRSWFGRLLGRPRGLRAALSPELRPLWHAAFTRAGATPRRVPVREACGRYVDWFAPAGSSMGERAR